MGKFKKKVVDHMPAGEDLGMDRTVKKGRKRTINQDGSYNIKKTTGTLFGNINPYHWIITASWAKYWSVLVGFYLVMNILFASIYFIIGTEQLSGLQGENAWTQWLYCFFFSAQSFTTVGYGGIHPVGVAANLLAVIEAFIGLMTFALATGSLYGRFSRPISKIRYSKNILIAPFRQGTAMQFMVASELNSGLMEMEATINISWNDLDFKGNPTRKFQQVKLEIDKIAMFPTSWVINHPINEESALYDCSMEELMMMDLEVFVLLKGFDDIFSQTIYSRHSYVVDNFVWGAKFRKPFHVDDQGIIIMDLSKVGDYDIAPMPDVVNKI